MVLSLKTALLVDERGVSIMYCMHACMFGGGLCKSKIVFVYIYILMVLSVILTLCVCVCVSLSLSLSLPPSLPPSLSVEDYNGHCVGGSVG